MLLAAGLAWRYGRAPLADGLEAGGHRAAPAIRFDNGTVRQYRTASASADGAPPPLALGQARRCARGNETVYTNQPCPPGMREERLNRGTVNVLAGGGEPLATLAPEKAAPAARRGLHQVAEPADGADLRR